MKTSPRVVAQTSRSAVSRVSKPADASTFSTARRFGNRRHSRFRNLHYRRGVVLALALAALFAVPTLRAQLVADGATNTLSNVTNSFTSDVIVGTNGSFTLLVLSNNAFLTNSGSGVIGLNATAKSNEVHLLSSTARWLMGGNLFVGSNGAFNRLTISNGATVRDGGSFMGFATASASNNLAV